MTLLTSELSTTSDFFETVLSDLRTNSNYSFVIYGVKASEDVWNTPYSLTGYLTTLPAGCYVCSVAGAVYPSEQC